RRFGIRIGAGVHCRRVGKAGAKLGGESKMLGRLILLLLQVAVGWFGTTALMRYITFAEFRLFIFAVVAAIVIFLIGVIAAVILKDVGSPSSATLSWALGFALIAAVLWTWGPQIPILSE